MSLQNCLHYQVSLSSALILSGQVWPGGQDSCVWEIWEESAGMILFQHNFLIFFYQIACAKHSFTILGEKKEGQATLCLV